MLPRQRFAWLCLVLTPLSAWAGPSPGQLPSSGSLSAAVFLIWPKPPGVELCCGVC